MDHRGDLGKCGGKIQDQSKTYDSKSERIRERIQKEYDSMNKTVKKNARRDKRGIADQLA